MAYRLSLVCSGLRGACKDKNSNRSSTAMYLFNALAASDDGSGNAWASRARTSGAGSSLIM